LRDTFSRNWAADPMFSTGVHSFAQAFFAKLIDAVNAKDYLPRQIEPEGKT
jgi:hypothetical protein